MSLQSNPCVLSGASVNREMLLVFLSLKRSFPFTNNETREINCIATWNQLCFMLNQMQKSQEIG